MADWKELRAKADRELAAATAIESDAEKLREIAGAAIKNFNEGLGLAVAARKAADASDREAILAEAAAFPDEPVYEERNGKAYRFTDEERAGIKKDQELLAAQPVALKRMPTAAQVQELLDRLTALEGKKS